MIVIITLTLFFYFNRTCFSRKFKDMFLDYNDVSFNPRLSLHNTFSINVPLLYPLKTSEKQRFSFFGNKVVKHWLKIGLQYAILKNL